MRNLSATGKQREWECGNTKGITIGGFGVMSAGFSHPRALGRSLSSFFMSAPCRMRGWVPPVAGAALSFVTLSPRTRPRFFGYEGDGGSPRGCW
jgi:hypothetical protein